MDRSTSANVPAASRPCVSSPRQVEDRPGDLDRGRGVVLVEPVLEHVDLGLQPANHLQYLGLEDRGRVAVLDPVVARLGAVLGAQACLGDEPAVVLIAVVKLGRQQFDGDRQALRPVAPDLNAI